MASEIIPQLKKPPSN